MIVGFFRLRNAFLLNLSTLSAEEVGRFIGLLLYFACGDVVKYM